MAEKEEVGDIVFQILLRSDVEDLIRYKCVCKSWLSLICDPVFIKTHLIHSYEKDRKNNITRRVVMAWLPDGLSPNHKYSGRYPSCFLIGSVNGLVCLVTPDVEHFFIDNPSIRRVVKQQLPPQIVGDITLLCAGFGYDSLTDDYKLIIGSGSTSRNHGTTTSSFQLLSLKSNVWKLIQLNPKYTFFSKVGVLCNGALHWFMFNNNNKVVIVSFDLSKEEFNEIPQPDDPRYQWETYHQLGIMNQCLAIYKRWVP